MVRLRKLILAAFLAASLSAVNVYASSVVPAQEPKTQEAQSEQEGPVTLFKATYSENNSEAFIPQIEGMKDTALQDTLIIP